MQICAQSRLEKYAFWRKYIFFELPIAPFGKFDLLWALEASGECFSNEERTPYGHADHHADDVLCLSARAM